MSILNESVLALNSGMVAIDVCTVREAIVDIYRNVAVPVTEADDLIRSPSLSIRVPRIISYSQYHKIPRKKVRFSRLNVIYRDDQKCVYCRKRFSVNQLTVDHVIPRSRWKSIMGTNSEYEFNSWRNLVSACSRCNANKGSKLLKELGWKLDFTPGEPQYLPSLVISRPKAEKLGWLDYCRYNVRLVDSIYAP